MHFSQTTSFSCILGRAVKSTARVQLGLNHDYKPETLQQKHLQCMYGTYPDTHGALWLKTGWAKAGQHTASF